MQLLEDNGSSWSLGLTGKEFEIESLKAPEVIIQTPLKMVVKWEDYFQSSKFTRFMTVCSNSEQIDFEMEVNWQSHNKLLKVVFPTAVSNGEAYFDQPYGYVKREENGKEFPAQKWIDYSTKNYGVSLLNNGKYGFTILNGILTMLCENIFNTLPFFNEIQQIVNHPNVATVPPLIILKSHHNPVVGLEVIGDIICCLYRPLSHLFIIICLGKNITKKEILLLHLLFVPYFSLYFFVQVNDLNYFQHK